MKRIVIFGNSGSGKSTLAHSFAADSQVAHLDLDSIAWQTPGVRKELQQSIAELSTFIRNHEQWVIEGCYASLITAAAAEAQEIIFLNPGVEACQSNCRARPWEPHKYESQAAQDRNLRMLLDWVAAYPTRTDEFSLSAHQQIYTAFSGTKQQLRSNQEAQTVAHQIHMEHTNLPIYGLVLVGGKSQRMGRDKALLSYDGEQSQLERTAHMLQQLCPRVLISQRKEQAFPTPAGTEAIYDSVDEAKGPLCGILSAMRAHPTAHWLVLACDLPNLQVATLEKLVSEFQKTEPQLTAYRSTHDGLPEPLCAIYPAGSDAGLLTLSQELGKSCPRKLLIVKEAALVEQDDPRSLDNVNTAEEYEKTVGKKLESRP